MAMTTYTETTPDTRADAATDNVTRALIRRFYLRVSHGDAQGQSFASNKERTVIGTHSSTDFTLRDRAMSRFHCEIAITGGVALVRDLGSRNGTYIDGVRVYIAPLRDGAILTLGYTQVRFELSLEHAEVPLSTRDRFGALVGGSAKMRAVYAVLERAAATDVTVLLQGETGTGKDLAASSIHQESARADAPLVIVDCGAIHAELLESELFGHERGAFTGADRARSGAFEVASGGTLFLDEIGELSLDLQPKLLRAIESREITRVGSTQPIRVDARIIAATNRNLREEVNAGRFRADLYYRLAVLQVELPALRERSEDIPALVHEMASHANMGAAATAALESPKLLAAIVGHTWPGNARELRNYLERCAALREPPALAPQETPAPPPSIDWRQPMRQGRQRWLQFFERTYLEQIMRAHNDSVSAAARAAGLDRVHFHRLLARNGLR